MARVVDKGSGAESMDIWARRLRKAPDRGGTPGDAALEAVAKIAWITLLVAAPVMLWIEYRAMVKGG